MALTGHWIFNDHTRDTSGYDNTPTDSATYVDGLTGKALDSNPSGDMNISVTPELEETFSGDEMTIMVRWYQYDGTSSSRWRDLIRYKDTDGGTRRLERGYADSNPSRSDYWCNIGTVGTNRSSSDIGPADTWFTLVIRRKGTTWESWVDGEVYHSYTESADMDPIDPASDLELNAASTGSYVDEIRFYSHAVSDADIIEFDRACVAHWRLGDMREPINNLYDSEKLSGWSANNGSNKSIVTDTSIPSYPESDQRIVLEKNADQSAGDDDQWHGTYRSNIAEQSASVGDVFSFSGWYKFYDETGDPQTTFKGQIYDSDTSWTGLGSETVQMDPDDNWYRFEFTAEVTSAPSNGYVEPAWQWGYDYGYQRLELCGLQIQKKENPASDFVNGVGSRPGKLFDHSGFENHGSVDGTNVSTTDSDVGSDAVEFDGSSGGIRVPNDPSLQLNDDLTIVYRLYPNDMTAQRENPINKAYGGEFTHTLETNSGGRINCYHGSSGSNSSPYMSPDLTGFNNSEWSSIGYSRDVSNRKVTMYVNGEVSDNYTWSDSSWEPPAKSSNDVIIGDGYTNTLNGRLDDIRLYASDLPQSFHEEYHKMRGRVTNTGSMKGYEFEEYPSKLLIEDYEWEIRNNEYNSLGTTTPVETNVSDWVESDDTLGNIAIAGEVYVTNTTYVPRTFEYTDQNNDRGFKLNPDFNERPDGWQVGWNEFYFPIPDSAYVSEGSTPWDNMDRLEVYRTGPDAGDTSESLRFRDVRLVKFPSDTDHQRFSVGDGGVIKGVGFDETDNSATTETVSDAPYGLKADRFDEI